MLTKVVLWVFLISLKFDSSEVLFVVLFGRFSRYHSILSLGQYLRSQSMKEKQIWKKYTWRTASFKFYLISSDILVAFLVLEFKVKTFSILLGPNDPKKVKKLQKSYTIELLALDLAFMTFMAFFGLFIAFWGLLMSKKSIRFICSYYLHSRTF